MMAMQRQQQQSSRSIADPRPFFFPSFLPLSLPLLHPPQLFFSYLEEFLIFSSRVPPFC